MPWSIRFRDPRPGPYTAKGHALIPGADLLSHFEASPGVSLWSHKIAAEPAHGGYGMLSNEKNSGKSET